MCVVGEKLRCTEATGYKVALKTKDGRYLSVSTPVEYKIGKVEKPYKYNSVAICDIEMHNYFNNLGFKSHISSLILLKGYYLCSEDFYSKTMLFREIEDALNFKLNCGVNNNPDNEIVILKITLSDKIYDGSYNLSRLFIGDTIKEIKELSKEEINEIREKE